MKLKLLFLILMLLLFGTTVHAQSSASILVNTVPPYPAPYENTQITLSSYAYNLDSVLISWSVNGKTALSGTGKKFFSVTAPAAGGETDIIATVYLPDGAIETKISIRPSVMTLLFQANDSFVPPFYKGKALPTPDSEVKVVAIPEISALGSSESLRHSLVDPNNMTYSWKKDYNNSVDGSGYGKNFFIYTNDYLDDSNNISVTASTIDQKYSNQADISIGTAQPKISFYKNDSVFGTLWEKTLNDPFQIKGPEVVQAVPYFISPKEIRTPSLVWSWFINDNQIDLPSFSKNLMPLQAEEGKHGSSKLRLEITNQYKIFQSVSKEINIEF